MNTPAYGCISAVLLSRSALSLGNMGDRVLMNLAVFGFEFKQKATRSLNSGHYFAFSLKPNIYGVAQH